MTITSAGRRPRTDPSDRGGHAGVDPHPAPQRPPSSPRRGRPDPHPAPGPGSDELARITWRDRLLASDPGNVRLALAARAALSLAAALGVAALVSSGLGLHGSSAMIVLVLGAVLTMMTTFTASDPSTVGRVITQLCLPVALLAGIVLSTLVDRHRVLSLALFVVVMFVAVWVRRFGPRAFACGMVVWMGYFMALFLMLGFGQLPMVLLAIGITTVLLLVISLVLAPQRPARRARRMVDAFAARVRIASAEHLDPKARSLWQRLSGRVGTADRALLRVNEVAVLLDGQLAVPGTVADPRQSRRIRAAVLRTESALARLLDTVPSEIGAAETTPVLEAMKRVRLVLREVGDDGSGRELTPGDAGRHDDRRRDVTPGDPGRHDDRRRDVTPGDAGPAGAGSRSPDAPSSFTPAAELFSGFLPGSAVTVGPMVAPEGATKLRLTTRQALQIAVGGGLSIALGDALSGQRWYWAVLACFLAFTGTATAAETVRKGMQRTLGTVVGVVVALGVVPLIGSSTALSLTVIMVTIFVGFYLFRVSYTALAFAITIMVAELYELLGTYSEGLLALRVEETALGAVIGAVVAVSLLPTSASRALEAARARLAEELRAATTDVAAVLSGRGATAGQDGAPVDLHARMRSLDFAIHQLALIGVPLTLRTAPGSGRRRDVVSGRLSAWVRCAAQVRAVIHAVEDSPSRRHDTVQGAMSTVRGLVDALADGRGPGAHLNRPDDGPDARGTLLAELASLHGVLVALHEIDPTARELEDAGSSEPEPAADRPADATVIRGRVTDAQGAGLEALVTAVDAHGRQRGRVRTDGAPRGAFAVPVGEGNGPWLLVVAAAGFAPHAGRAPAGPPHHVVLEPARSAATIPL